MRSILNNRCKGSIKPTLSERILNHKETLEKFSESLRQLFQELDREMVSQSIKRGIRAKRNNKQNNYEKQK